MRRREGKGGLFPSPYKPSFFCFVSFLLILFIYVFMDLRFGYMIYFVYLRIWYNYLLIYLFLNGFCMFICSPSFFFSFYVFHLVYLFIGFAFTNLNAELGILRSPNAPSLSWSKGNAAIYH